MTAWVQALRQSWDDYKRRAEELPPGPILCGPFSTRLRDWIIAGQGLFTRTKRKNRRSRIASILYCILSPLALTIVAIAGVVSTGDWTIMVGAVAQIIVMTAFIIWEVIPHGYRQVLEIRDNRIFVGKRDCGPLARAYVQPVSGLTYAVVLYTSAFPRGVTVTSVNTRQDLDMLCANLMMHLHLDGHHEGDWPPHPERGAHEAGSQSHEPRDDARIDAHGGENG